MSCIERNRVAVKRPRDCVWRCFSWRGSGGAPEGYWRGELAGGGGLSGRATACRRTPRPLADVRRDKQSRLRAHAQPVEGAVASGPRGDGGPRGPWGGRQLVLPARHGCGLLALPGDCVAVEQRLERRAELLVYVV